MKEFSKQCPSMNDVVEIPYNEKRKLININDNAISGNGIKATDDNYINSKNTYRGKYLMEHPCLIMNQTNHLGFF